MSLGEPLAGLLLTCVGVPGCRHRPGGMPGAPTRMRPLTRAQPEPTRATEPGFTSRQTSRQQPVATRNARGLEETRRLRGCSRRAGSRDSGAGRPRGSAPTARRNSRTGERSAGSQDHRRTCPSGCRSDRGWAWLRPNSAEPQSPQNHFSPHHRTSTREAGPRLRLSGSCHRPDAHSRRRQCRCGAGSVCSGSSSQARAARSPRTGPRRSCGRPSAGNSVISVSRSTSIWTLRLPTRECSAGRLSVRLWSRRRVRTAPSPGPDFIARRASCRRQRASRSARKPCIPPAIAFVAGLGTSQRSLWRRFDRRDPAASGLVAAALVLVTSGAAAGRRVSPAS